MIIKPSDQTCNSSYSGGKDLPRGARSTSSVEIIGTPASGPLYGPYLIPLNSMESSWMVTHLFVSHSLNLEEDYFLRISLAVYIISIMNFSHRNFVSDLQFS